MPSWSAGGDEAWGGAAVPSRGMLAVVRCSMRVALGCLLAAGLGVQVRRVGAGPWVTAGRVRATPCACAELEGRVGRWATGGCAAVGAGPHSQGLHGTR